MENQNINLIENENKSTKSKILTWVSTILLACAVGVCAVLNAVMPRYQKSSAYSVDYSSEYVEFSAYELNNYTFTDLGNKINDLADFESSSYIMYNNTRYIIDEFLSNDYISYTIEVSEDSSYITFNLNEYKFYYDINDEGFSFEYPIRWYSEWLVHNIQKQATLTASELNSNHYVYLANEINTLENSNYFANSYIIYNNQQFFYDNFDTNSTLVFIEENSGEEIGLRLDANNLGIFYTTLNDGVFTDSITIYSDYLVDNLYAGNDISNWLDDIIALLTGGIVGFSHGVGSGTSTLVTDIFISNNALSVFGGMIVVFAGISLAIGLCRFIMNFLTSLGAKK